MKACFSHLAAACQCLPGVAKRLLGLGWTHEQIDGALNLGGVERCLSTLRESGIYVAFDGSVSTGVVPPQQLAAQRIPWGQVLKFHSRLLAAMESIQETSLRAMLSERQLARLNGCSGPVSGRWLSQNPASWWPAMGDDKFVEAIRWHLGVPVVPAGLRCQHARSKGPDDKCGEDLDRFGDHAAACQVGPYVAARHSALNAVLAQTGKEAGYAALLEQVVPELGLKKRRRGGQIVQEEAVLDIGLFGHPTAPDRLLDGTVRHPCASHMVRDAATRAGAAAAEGVACKEKRYPTRAGKAVWACAAETWGFIDPGLDRLLKELAVLAAQRQRDRGMVPTRWHARWRTQVSLQMALHLAKALLMAKPAAARPCCCLPLVEDRSARG